MDEAKIRSLFDAQADEYATSFGLDKEVVKVALREHAKRWSGCMSCVFSRPYSPQGYELNESERWRVRSCTLGLRQDGCRAHTKIPEE